MKYIKTLNELFTFDTENGHDYNFEIEDYAFSKNNIDFVLNPEHKEMVDNVYDYLYY